jgi:hypothetical protein
MPEPKIIRLVQGFFEITPKMLKEYDHVVVRSVKDDVHTMGLAGVRLRSTIPNNYHVHLEVTNQGRPYYEFKRIGDAA